MTSATHVEGARPSTWKMAVLFAAGIACMYVVYAAVAMSALDLGLVVVTLLAAGWWVGARDHSPAALNVVSLTALGLAVAVRLIEGPRWQLVPWQVAAVVVGAMAGDGIAPRVGGRAGRHGCRRPSSGSRGCP